jgi:Ni/Fe-hydrogenase subunit HybB-like protein
MMNKMSPLWYNPLIAYFFLVSAVAMGLSMVSLESIISAKAFGHKPHFDILRGLAKGSTWALLLYFVMKVIYLMKGDGGVGAAFAGTMEANIYLAELGIGVVLPLLLLLLPGTNQSVNSLLFVNILVVGGVLLNRMSIAVFSTYGYAKSMDGSYFPSLAEFVITLGIVALGIYLFKLVAKYLALFPEAEPEY